MTKISYTGYPFPREIIRQAVWLYLRLPLRFRDIEDLWAELMRTRLRWLCAETFVTGDDIVNSAREGRLPTSLCLTASRVDDRVRFKATGRSSCCFLSFREGEDLLAERGITVSDETVRR